MIALFGLPLWNSAQAKPGEQCPAVLNHEFPRLQDEKTISLCDFKGQVLLVVNTASFCGFTNQYEELEKVHSQYKSKGFSVVGFPSSDFGNQEYKSNKEIAAFCNNTFGVKFPMFAKTVVKGDSANPLYKQLAKASGEQPGWNFHKYLINRKGEVVGTFKSGVSPTSPQITQAIRRALDAHPITEQ
ncbi:glutathione peroxidase [Limnobacter sp.]|uniref:glutathione peroxidase n=1 Tax=Limnobacter sp. TaxID=2003368 RepID=UPI0027B94422|nr:glutathione peroxidase [Limnobacter sp.]